MEEKKIKVVVVGCGDRATVYCEEGVNQLHKMEVVAAVDPDPERLRYMREHFGITEEQCYTNMEDVLSQGKIADCVINGTMDTMHYETTIPFLKQGYHVLLENAKCCHDLDLICWLNNEAAPVSVQSDGGRNYFVRDKAPKGSGNRCLVDCPEEIRKNCVYDVQSMYLDNCWFPWYPWQCTGKNWQDVTFEEKVESLKTYNPHGRCIYKCDEGDIVDHQNVMIHFDDGSTAMHTVTLGAMRPGRSLWIQGTKGELEGFVDEGTLYYRFYHKESSGCDHVQLDFTETEGGTGGHYGGDKGLVSDFCSLMQGGESSISCTSIDDSINGHMLCYAADEALKTKSIIELK